MKLPNAEHAIISSEKRRDYILSPAHPIGRFKATFFERLGYKRGEWEVLERDLRSQHLGLDVSEVEANEFGRKFVVQGPISGPNGVIALIVSVWIILHNETTPRFVTAYPGGR